MGYLFPIVVEPVALKFGHPPNFRQQFFDGWEVEISLEQGWYDAEMLVCHV
jgi:hypothetical protein